MPLYDYLCRSCLADAEKIKGSALTNDEKGEVIFETSHGFEPTPEELAYATTCPRCGGVDVERSYLDTNIICYIRGNGYLDRAGCHTDMNIRTLETDDPYADMREPGEVDDLKSRLKKSAQHNPNTRYFPPSGGTDGDATS